MAALYNIYYAGEILDGFQPEQVRSSLGQLFKAGDATLDKLFSGKPQLLKRECDRATALKYKQAMEKVGARALVREASPQAADAAKAEPAKAQTAAERIAALAAAPDVGSSPAGSAAPTATATGTDEDEAGLKLTAEGTEVLKPEERAQEVVADIDTSGLDLDPPVDRLAAEAAAAPPAPDTSHLSMAEVGEDIPTLADSAEALSPNTEALDLAPEGTDFSDCAKPEAEPPELDLSALALSPAGSDVLDETQRKRRDPPAPDTGHIHLQD